MWTNHTATPKNSCKATQAKHLYPTFQILNFDALAQTLPISIHNSYSNLPHPNVLVQLILSFHHVDNTSHGLIWSNDYMWSSNSGQWGGTTHGMRSSTDNVWSFGRAPNSVIIKWMTFLNITCCTLNPPSKYIFNADRSSSSWYENLSKITKGRSNKDLQYQGCAVPREQVWHYTSLALHLPLAEVKDPLQRKNLGTLRVDTNAASEVCEDGDIFYVGPRRYKYLLLNSCAQRWMSFLNESIMRRHYHSRLVLHRQGQFVSCHFNLRDLVPDTFGEGSQLEHNGVPVFNLKRCIHQSKLHTIPTP